jgi:hypothetical protein
MPYTLQKNLHLKSLNVIPQTSKPDHVPLRFQPVVIVGNLPSNNCRHWVALKIPACKRTLAAGNALADQSPSATKSAQLRQFPDGVIVPPQMNAEISISEAIWIIWRSRTSTSSKKILHSAGECAHGESTNG